MLTAKQNPAIMSESIEHSALVSELQSLSWSDVKCMAIHLDRMDLAVLDQIEENHPNDSKQRVMYAMKEWLQRDTEASWKKVVGALRKINMNALATEIEGKYYAVMTTPHFLEPTPLLSSQSASLESQPTSSVATASTCSSTGPLVHSLEHIAMPSQDETCIDEIQGIKNKAAMLQTKFTRVLIHTKICFMDKEEESGKFLRDFQVTLTSLPLFKQHENKDFLKEEKIHIKKAKDVDKNFDILDPYWNYVDYDLLEYIVKEFGTEELQKEMKEYIAELEQFEKKTTVHDFNLATWDKVLVPAHYRNLSVKLEEDSKECTLHDVRQFKNSIVNQSSLENYTLLFEGVSCSSVSIIFAFPPEAYAKLSETFKDEQFKRKHEVVSEEFSLSTTPPVVWSGLLSERFTIVDMFQEPGPNLHCSEAFKDEQFNRKHAVVLDVFSLSTTPPEVWSDLFQKPGPNLHRSNSAPEVMNMSEDARRKKGIQSVRC